MCSHKLKVRSCMPICHAWKLLYHGGVIQTVKFGCTCSTVLWNIVELGSYLDKPQYIKCVYAFFGSFQPGLVIWSFACIDSRHMYSAVAQWCPCMQYRHCLPNAEVVSFPGKWNRHIYLNKTVLTKDMLRKIIISLILWEHYTGNLKKMELFCMETCLCTGLQ